jgi:hypothetical protein
VLGAGAVTVVDARDMRYTDSHAAHRGQPLAMLGVKLDVLTSGCRYEIERRAAHPPPQGAVRLDPLEALKTLPASESAAAEAAVAAAAAAAADEGEDAEAVEAQRAGAGAGAGSGGGRGAGDTLADRTADRGD